MSRAGEQTGRREGLLSTLGDLRPALLAFVRYLRALWSEFNEDEYRVRFAQRIGDNNDGLNFTGSLVDGQGSWSGLLRENELRRELKDKRIFNITAGAEKTFGAFELETEAAFNDNQQREPNSDWEFRDSSTSGSYNSNSFLFGLTPDPATTFDPDQYRFQRVRFQDYKVDTQGWSASADLIWNADFLPAESFLKTGLLLRTSEKTQDFEQERFDRQGTCTMGAFGLSGGLLANNVDGQAYEIGPIPDGAALDRFFVEQPQCFTINEGDTAQSDALNDFVIDEQVLAGYVMANVAVTDRLTLIAGVRVESTEVETAGSQLDPDLNVTPVSSDGSYANVLPGLHLRYAIGENTLARFAWTNTIGRPLFDDLRPGRLLDYEENTDINGDGLGTFIGGFSTGNPDLEAFESTNFDLSLEHYLDDLGILSVAAFYKEIEGFIVSEQVTLAGGAEGLPPIEFEGRTYTDLSFSRPHNAESGEIIRIEFGYRQDFKFLPGFWGNFGAGASYTYTDSELVVDGRALPFEGQAENIASGQLYYQGDRIGRSVAFDGDFVDICAATAIDDTGEGRSVTIACRSRKLRDVLQNEQ